MPEQDWNNLKFNIERVLPSPYEHEQRALEGQVHDLSNRIKAQMAMNKRELSVYDLFPEVVEAIKNKGFKIKMVEANPELLKLRSQIVEYKIRW